MEWLILIFVLLAARNGSTAAASPRQPVSTLPVQQGRVPVTSVETHIPVINSLLQPDAPSMTSLKVDSHLNSIHQLAYTDSLFTSDTEGLGPDQYERERPTLGFQ